MNANTRQRIWLRATRKYQKLINAFDGTTFICRKLDILRRRILHMNRAWKLGIATASLMAWLNTPVMGQFPAVFELSDLDGSNGFVLNGIDDYDYAGISVSNLGDVNGDGIDDIIIGASGADNNGMDRAGESYVIFGKIGSFSSSLELSSLDGSNGFVLRGEGETIFNYSGRPVSGTGDVNNDGFNDFIVTDRGSNRTIGKSYVVFGRSIFASSLELSSIGGSTGFIINGIDRFDRASTSVDIIQDVNNDNFDDIIIGAPRAETNGYASGDSYVVFGGSNLSNTELSSLDGSNGFTLNGISPYDLTGFSVSSAGDINSDGYNDMVIGTPQVNSGMLTRSGKSYVVFGQSSFIATLELSNLDGSNGFSIDGVSPFDGLGRVVNSAGDVNNDGYDDFIIGASGAMSNVGESYIIFGGDSFAANFNLSDLNGSNGFTMKGIDAEDGSGYSIDGAGDINGDGYDDIVIGAHRADPNGSNSGESYIVFGSSNFGSDVELSGLNGVNGFKVDGVATEYGLGHSVSAAGDMNGDGIDDLLLGGIGYYYNYYGSIMGNPNSIKGRSYVIFGECHSITPTISVTVSPTSTAEDASSTLTYTIESLVNACSSDLIVNFSISGTASPSTDFTLSGESSFNPMTGRGTITIPQGSNSAVLTVTPIGDAVVEPDETVIVTIENP